MRPASRTESQTWLVGKWGIVILRSSLIDGTRVFQELYTSRSKKNSSMEEPKRYPEQPAAGHNDCISDIGVIQTSQTFVVSASKNGVVKVWKWSDANSSLFQSISFMSYFFVMNQNILQESHHCQLICSCFHRALLLWDSARNILMGNL